MPDDPCCIYHGNGGAGIECGIGDRNDVPISEMEPHPYMQIQLTTLCRICLELYGMRAGKDSPIHKLG